MAAPSVVARDGREVQSRWRRRRRWLVPFIVVSILLHGLFTAVLMIAVPRPPATDPLPTAESPISFAVEEAPTEQQTIMPPTPDPAEAAPMATAGPEISQPPPQAADMSAQPPAEPPVTPPSAAEQAKAEPPPPVPEEALSPPPPPPPPPPVKSEVEFVQPAPAQPEPPREAPPEPPREPPRELPREAQVPPKPPAPPLPRPAPPQMARPQQPPRPPAPQPSPPASNGEWFIPPSPRTPGRGTAAEAGRGPMNLSLGRVDQYRAEPPRRNPNDKASDLAITGAQLGSDWERELRAYWMAHRYYPQVAAQRGEQGVVTVHMHINRSGRVTAVDLVASSGSQFIDAAALGTWRGAQLAPFPTNTPEDEADITISMMYVITR